MPDRESRLKHLDFIQGVVNRLSTNSFLLKGWSVILVSAIFMLSDRERDVAFMLLAFLPAMVFWGLDAYFLRQERMYRQLYDKVRLGELEKIDFSMNAEIFAKDADSLLRVAASKTLLPFHGVIVVAISIVMYLRIE